MKIHSLQKRSAGFTLLEIMVVVIIIGLLAAVVVPQFLGRVDDARVAKAKQDIQAMQTALTMFKLDNYVYPTTDMGLKALAQKPDAATIKNWQWMPMVLFVSYLLYGLVRPWISRRWQQEIEIETPEDDEAEAEDEAAEGEVKPDRDSHGPAASI